jgi:crotonobetainyl-CoA:carnitine CoA-transferase CaiB-like acyl-CoA transferase
VIFLLDEESKSGFEPINPWKHPSAAFRRRNLPHLEARFWKGTKRLMGDPPWAEDPMFQTLASRIQNIDAVEALVMQWLSEHSKQEAFQLSQAQHVPCFPVHSPREVAENPQYRERGFFRKFDHPAAGEVTMPGAPYVLGKTPWRLKRGAPRLGEHNQKILIERLGLDHQRLDLLRAEGAI